MEFHELANIFPLMEGAEFDALVESIKNDGIDNPICLHENKILDGRNRWRACILAKVEPMFFDYKGDDPLGYVVRQNMHRRDLTPGQRAFIALKIKDYYAKQAKENMRKGGGDKKSGFENFQNPIEEPIDATQRAADEVGVNANYVSAAAQIEEKSPDLAEKVKSGAMSMNRAKTEHKKREKKKKVQQYALEMQSAPALEKEYQVIYADPPWQYSDNTNTLDAVTDHHYSTMSIDDISEYLKKFNVKTTKDAVLFMWVTNPFIVKALSVISAWGFEYKTNIVWVKKDLKKPGVGYYVRGRHELLFVCTKGSFTPLDKNISPPIGSVLEAPINEHSKKPHDVYNIIERLYPGCTYIELFARNKREGWDCLGDES